MKTLVLLTTSCLLLMTNINAQGRYTVSCSLANENTTTIFHDQPLLISISVANKNLYKDWQWNLAADEWIHKLETNFKAGLLSEEDFTKEKAKALKGKKTLIADTLGSDAQPWYEQVKFYVYRNDTIQLNEWPVSRLGRTPSEAVAVLDENAYYALDFHLPPDMVTLIKPGTYSMKVRLGAVWSNEVKFTILPENIPSAELHVKEMQLRLGQYYWLVGNADKVFSFASAVLQKDPFNIEALILRGESHIMKENFKLALADFETALQQHNKKFPGLYEPPEYLIGMIDWLKEK